MGRSRGGLTTKIHLLADTLGRPLRIIVTAEQVGDITQASALLEGQSGDAVLADKAHDSNAFRAGIGARAVIPSNRSRKIIIPRDALAYRHRNRIERCIQPNEALPALRNTLRSKNHSFLRLRLSHCRNDLDAVNVDWSWEDFDERKYPAWRTYDWQADLRG